MVAHYTSNGIEKSLKGREDDIDLIVNGTSNVVNVTFILRNLVRSDAMNYIIDVINSRRLSDEIETSLNVLGKMAFLKSSLKQYLFLLNLLPCNIFLFY